jgi:hypothetical protein
MKTKDFRKKLVLNKNTIADLKNEGMKDVDGAGQPPTNGTWCDGSCLFPSECYSYPIGHHCTQC